MDGFAESKEESVQIKIRKESENFRFGSSDIYKSEENYEIEVEIGNLKEKIRVSVVDANIPLILGMEYQKT